MEKLTRKGIESFVKKHKTGKKTLDIGAGEKPYSKLFPNSVTVDIDLHTNPDVVGDVHKLPFKKGEFHVVLATEVLEHCKDPQKAMKELSRVLKKNGKVILTTRFVYPYHAPPDYYRFTPEAIRELAKNAGLKVQSIREEKAFSEILHRLQHNAKGVERTVLASAMFALRPFDKTLPTTGIYALLVKK